MAPRESSEDYIEAIPVFRRLREACRMEHCISGSSFRRLADHLAGLRGQGGGG